jgi:hypothetical protein
MYICLEEEEEKKEEYFFSLYIFVFPLLPPLPFPFFFDIKIQTERGKMESARRPKGIVSERAHAG